MVVCWSGSVHIRSCWWLQSWLQSEGVCCWCCFNWTKCAAVPFEVRVHVQGNAHLELLRATQGVNVSLRRRNGRGDGRDVLAAAASNPKLAHVPKVVMSSFLREEEMEQAIQLGARCFIPKPTGLDAFLTTVGGKVSELLGTLKD